MWHILPKLPVALANRQVKRQTCRPEFETNFETFPNNTARPKSSLCSIHRGVVLYSFHGSRDEFSPTRRFGMDFGRAYCGGILRGRRRFRDAEEVLQAIRRSIAPRPQQGSQPLEGSKRHRLQLRS